MSARIHYLQGPPGARRVERLLAAYQEATREFGTALLLVPTRRLAVQVRSRLPTTLAPNIFDLQHFADELVRCHDPAIRPHSDLGRQLLLDSILAELREGSDMPYFAGVAETRGYAESALGYVAELKDAGVDYRRLVKASPTKEGGGSQNRHAEAARIFTLYNSRLKKLHRLDPPDRIGRAAALWNDGQYQPFDRLCSLFLVGFFSFSMLEQGLINALRETLEHVWIELPEASGDTYVSSRAIANWLGAPVGKPSLVNVGPDVDREIIEPDSTQPPELRSLANLFREKSSSDATAGLPERGLHDPIHLIEAAGAIGEARLVARRIRLLLHGGIAAERILVVSRRLSRSTCELYREVFEEYAIPYDIEGAEPLSRIPVVAFLMQAWRLPAEDWPFAQVAAILRSSLFRPNWPEVLADPEVAARSETLLRMLGEPRGKDAYLSAVQTWEHTPPEPLEDEQAEEPLRQRKQRLAARCRPFLERFFATWDRLKSAPGAMAAVAQFEAFAAELGVSEVSLPDSANAAGLARLWQELDRWARTDATSTTRKLTRPDRFTRVLGAIASVRCRGRTPRDSSAVALLSAEAAVGLTCDYLVLIGLGEGSWPDLSPPTSLLDDAERERLRAKGLPLDDPAARLHAEQFRFVNLATAPRLGLVLSYPATDDRGETLLPGSFLRELLHRFPSGVPRTRQRMILEGFFDEPPLGMCELRVQIARHWNEAGSNPSLPEAVRDNLQRAAEVVKARFRTGEYGPFDGVLKHPAVAAELKRRFAPERVLSPTSLETYVACPFRFLLQQVLRLEPLQDPTEEVERTRRGSAVHRALARFHEQLNCLPDALRSDDLPPRVTEGLISHIQCAVEEYARRAPSVATAVLWRLEGERLCRSARRYRGHWQEFRKPWRQNQATPRPYRFEADFGVPGDNVPEPLVITMGDIEVRIGGRIDRVDVAEIEGLYGFWVIDYKTGRGSYYQPSQVERFEKLQLPLYALAVERVLFKGKMARPLGLAYWLVTDEGPKPMLPSKRSKLAWLSNPQAWEHYREQLEGWVATLVREIRAGSFPLSPRSELCTETCDFGPVCRISQSRNTGKRGPLALPVIEKEQKELK